MSRCAATVELAGRAQGHTPAVGTACVRAPIHAGLHRAVLALPRLDADGRHLGLATVTITWGNHDSSRPGRP